MLIVGVIVLIPMADRIHVPQLLERAAAVERDLLLEARRRREVSPTIADEVLGDNEALGLRKPRLTTAQRRSRSTNVESALRAQDLRDGPGWAGPSRRDC